MRLHRGFTTFMRTERGFTLIELLIVVTIIAILAAIGLFAYGLFLKNSRDAKRQSDLKLIQSALEQYFADQKFYPIDRDMSNDFNDFLVADQQAFTSSTGNPSPPPAANTKTYLKSAPKDPLNSPRYCYLHSPTSCNNTANRCTGYTLYAKLENPPAGASSCGGNSTYNLGVTPP